MSGRCSKRVYPYLTGPVVVKMGRACLHKGPGSTISVDFGSPECPLEDGLRDADGDMNRLPVGFREAEVPGDDPSHDLAGPLPDLQDLGIPVIPRHGEILHVAVPAVD